MGVTPVLYPANPISHSGIRDGGWFKLWLIGPQEKIKVIKALEQARWDAFLNILGQGVPQPRTWNYLPKGPDNYQAVSLFTEEEAINAGLERLMGFL